MLCPPGLPELEDELELDVLLLVLDDELELDEELLLVLEVELELDDELLLVLDDELELDVLEFDVELEVVLALDELLELEEELVLDPLLIPDVVLEVLDEDELVLPLVELEVLDELALVDALELLLLVELVLDEPELELLELEDEPLPPSLLLLEPPPELQPYTKKDKLTTTKSFLNIKKHQQSNRYNGQTKIVRFTEDKRLKPMRPTKRKNSF